jgi:hypothetical protein
MLAKGGIREFSICTTDSLPTGRQGRQAMEEGFNLYNYGLVITNQSIIV